MILVLDTSIEHGGQRGGAKNIFPEVKSSLTKFISKLDVGDSLTVMTFDSNVKNVPTVKIRHAEDKEIINNYIAMVEAKGLWTYTMGMLKQVFEKAQGFQKASPDRQQVIVISLTS
jgi:helix-turn-helix protein